MYGRHGENEMTESAQPPGAGGDGDGIAVSISALVTVEDDEVISRDVMVMIKKIMEIIVVDGYFCYGRN